MCFVDPEKTYDHVLWILWEMLSAVVRGSLLGPSNLFMPKGRVVFGFLAVSWIFSIVGWPLPELHLCGLAPDEGLKVKNSVPNYFIR